METTPGGRVFVAMEDPYSLGILIEWKLKESIFELCLTLSSLLARDIN
ncbi:hypothetical protein [Umezakia ovalisporum]